MLKRPDYLILNRPFSGFDAASQVALADFILDRAKSAGGFGLLWVLANRQLASRFDKVLVLEGGRLVEQGDPKSLADSKAYKELVGAG